MYWCSTFQNLSHIFFIQFRFAIPFPFCKPLPYTGGGDTCFIRSIFKLYFIFIPFFLLFLRATCVVESCVLLPPVIAYSKRPEKQKLLKFKKIVKFEKYKESLLWCFPACHFSVVFDHILAALPVSQYQTKFVKKNIFVKNVLQKPFTKFQQDSTN